jgi:hypothetical protein
MSQVLGIRHPIEVQRDLYYAGHIKSQHLYIILLHLYRVAESQHLRNHEAVEKVSTPHTR